MELTDIKRLTLRTEPKMFDKVIQEVQQCLATDLKWLNHSFGRCERLLKSVDGVRRYTPNLYIGKGEYVSLLPDEGIGNYCFFVMDEPENVSWSRGELALYKAPYSLIMWVDMRTVDFKDERNDEEIKERVLNVLNGGTWLRNGRITVTNIYSRCENVFRDFSIDEVQNQFLMAPFIGWRFTGEITLHGECNDRMVNYLFVKPEEVQWINQPFDYNIFTNTEWKILT